MSTSAIDLSWAAQERKPVRLRSLKSGLRKVQRRLKRCSTDPFPSSWLAELDDYVKCIDHEIRFLEEFPPDALGQIQEERLEHLCNSALALLKRREGKQALMLQSAFRKLLPSLVKDFDKVGRFTAQ